MFQSAPRSFDRGDAFSNPCFPSPRCFNPRPGPSTGATRFALTAAAAGAGFNPRPGPSTGATAAAGRCHSSGEVSIRAPVLRPGRRPRFCRPACRWNGFNPRPGPSTGATRSVLRGKQACNSFNPRPGPSTGATDARVFLPVVVQVSIRAPVLRPGRLSIKAPST